MSYEPRPLVLQLDALTDAAATARETVAGLTVQAVADRDSMDPVAHRAGWQDALRRRAPQYLASLELARSELNTSIAMLERYLALSADWTK